MAENNTQKREEDLENTREAVEELERRMRAEVRRQEKLDMMEEKNFRREKLLGKYIVKMLYGWND